MTESKLAPMQKLLQATYDFYDQTPLSEFSAGVAAQAKNDLHEEPFPGEENYGSASYSRFVESGVRRYATEAGLNEEEFALAAAWLIARGLMSYTNEWLPSGFKLTTLGEDLIDLEITVEEWYQGPYRENLLNNAPTDTSPGDKDQ